ncbi:hypothetical protein ABZ890_47300 [Streptomyces sp. NPDC046984]|uniref:hypothetical protein n=1 Tax=Streptomyces sp. NPDC046984 TaxID=3155138 RepID=UPI0033D1B33F
MTSAARLRAAVDVRANVWACDFRSSPRQITVVIKAIPTMKYLIRDRDVSYLSAAEFEQQLLRADKLAIAA